MGLPSTSTIMYSHLISKVTLPAVLHGRRAANAPVPSSDPICPSPPWRDYILGTQKARFGPPGSHRNAPSRKIPTSQVRRRQLERVNRERLVISFHNRARRGRTASSPSRSLVTCWPICRLEHKRVHQLLHTRVFWKPGIGLCGVIPAEHTEYRISILTVCRCSPCNMHGAYMYSVHNHSLHP